MSDTKPQPQPVIVDNPEPIAVTVAAETFRPSATAENPPAKATTTSEQNLHSLGQRRINLIWETTQAVIAVVVTVSTLYVAAKLALKDNAQTAAFLLLSNAFFLVIGFYFSRSNHARINDTAPTGKIDTR